MLTNMLNTPIISFNSTGITLVSNVAINNNRINVLADLTASGTITSNTVTINTLSTSGAGITIKSNLVMFRGMDNIVYMHAHLGGVWLLK